MIQKLLLILILTSSGLLADKLSVCASCDYTTLDEAVQSAQKGDTLIVRLSSASLREELSYGKEKIVKMMNENIGKTIINKVKLL